MIKCKIYIFLLFLLFLACNVHSQTLDSLKTALRDESLGKQEQLEVLILISEKYVDRYPDSALFYVTEGNQMISSDLPASLRLQWWVNEGAIRIKNQQLPLAEEALLKAKEDPEIHDFPIIKGKCYLNLAAIYLQQQSYDQSLDLANAALTFIDEDLPLQIKAYNNLGILYSRIGEFEKALVNLEKAKELNMSDDLIKLSTLLNLAGLYSDRKEYEKAIESFSEAGVLAESFQHFPALAVMHSNLSNLYNEINDYDKSLTHAKQGLEIKEQYNLPGKVFSLNNVGYAYYLKENYDQAIYYFLKALPEARGKEKLTLLFNLKNAYQKSGQLGIALNYFDQHAMLKDSLDALDYKAKVAEIDAKYESDKKQYEIDLLNIRSDNQQAALQRKNFAIVGILAFSLLGFGLIYSIYRQNKIRQGYEKEILQQRLIRMQLNPHFIFHALNGINSFLYQNQAERSINYLSRFSKLMRFILEKSEIEWVNMEEEIEMLDHYLQLQQLNFNDRFTYEIQVDEELDPSDLMVPTLLTQPILENALIHGLSQVPEGKLTLNYRIEGNGLLIKITDNGHGYKMNANTSNKMHVSMSTDLIEKRLKHIQKNHKGRVGLEYKPLTDSSERPGTIANIYLPLVFKPI